MEATLKQPQQIVAAHQFDHLATFVLGIFTVGKAAIKPEP